MKDKIKTVSKPILTLLFLIITISLIYISIDSIFPNSKTEAAWYASGGTWTNRKGIVVDPQKVSGTTTLTNFPMLVSVIDPDLKHTSHGGKVGKTDGTDILFTSSDGSTKLDHEIEKYASTTGELIAWVKIPSLSPTTTTSTYIYFGNSGASDQQNVSGVWDSDYKLVAHLPNGSTLSAADSTTNNATPTISGASATTGQVDGGASFNSNGISYPDSTALNPTSAITTSIWFKKTRNANNEMFIHKGNATTNANSAYELMTSYQDKVRFEISTAAWHTAENPTTITDTNWHYAVGTYDGSFVSLYIDGVSVAATAASVSINNDTNVLTLGRLVNAEYYLVGSLDEVRISSVARSADWVATEYNNQYSPSTFYSYEGLNVEQKNVSNSKLMNKVKVRGGVKFR